MKHTYQVRLTALALAMATCAAQATTILNGSFESPLVTSNTAESGTPYSWTSGSSTGFIFNGLVPNVPDGNWPGPQDGQQFVDIGNTSSYSLSQSFTITIPGVYELAWFDNAFHLADTSPYRVTIVSSSLQTILSADFNAAHGGDWFARMEEITLPNDTYTLAFTPQGLVKGFDTLLDNVAVTQIPESSGTLFAICGAIVLLCGRRRTLPLV